MSPQLLLVLMVALLTASLAGLFLRRSFLFLPLYWVIGVSALLTGQVVGTAAGWSILTVGQVELGAGLLLNVVMILALHILTLWYNRR